ncbi:MAG: ribonuclease PH, partial [Firmicutes bacterium]|nr:ribonuclease PH [Bacillota bacterium]
CTASITAGFMAVMQALTQIHRQNPFAKKPIKDWLAAISVGLIDQQALLDLNYLEDSHTDVDMNIVMQASHDLVEIQGTGEHNVFSPQQLSELVTLAQSGIDAVIALEKAAWPEGGALIG